ncbi:hypothetical protein J6590_067533 [Homalodisca vitripennis]|nr:hypothetical protein J6590_067533 [Homalodisca vitripennis]
MPKYPCGKCTRNVGKCHAVLCKGTCSKWFHLKCTDLKQEGFKQIEKHNTLWFCNECNLINLSYKEDQDVENINEDLTSEIENLNEVIKTLNEELTFAKEEITELRSHSSRLEILVLEKEEKNLLLERKLKALLDQMNVNVGKEWQSERKSLPLVKNIQTPHNTPVATSEKELFSNVVSKNIRNPSKGKMHIKKQPLSTISTFNYYEVLSSDTDDYEDELQNIDAENVQVKVQNIVTKKKLLLCSDSHGRDVAWNINNIQNSFEAIGYVKPGGKSEQVLNMINFEKENCSNDDVLVLMCGANDVAKNESQVAINNITKALEMAKCYTSNVVLVDLPNRYDLAEWSCVNEETKKTNEILKKLSEKYPNVTLVEASKANKHLHTRHGLHLSVSGKRWLAHEIIQAVRDNPEKRPTSSLSTESPVLQSAQTNKVNNSGNSPSPVPSRHPPSPLMTTQ